MEKSDERKSFETQAVNKAIKIKYIHCFPFISIIRLNMLRLPEGWKLTFSNWWNRPQGGSCEKANDTMKESSYRLQVKKVTFPLWLAGSANGQSWLILR